MWITIFELACKCFSIGNDWDIKLTQAKILNWLIIMLETKLEHTFMHNKLILRYKMCIVWTKIYFE